MNPLTIEISYINSSQTNLSPLILQLQQSLSKQQMFVVSLIKQQLLQQQQQGFRSPYFEEALKIVSPNVIKLNRTKKTTISPLLQKIATFENSNNINQLKNLEEIQSIQHYSPPTLERESSTETSISGTDADSQSEELSSQPCDLLSEYEINQNSLNNLTSFKILRRNGFKQKSREMDKKD